MSTCNHCVLQRIKERKPKGSRVVLHPSDSIPGWTDVYIVPKGEELDTRQHPKTGNHLSSQFKASMMEITNHCVC